MPHSPLQDVQNLSLLIEGTIFPQIIARTIISFFASKGNDYSVKGGDYLKYCSLKVVP